MVSAKFLEKRFQCVRDLLKKKNLDGAIISDEISLRWLTGHSFTSGYLLVTGTKSVFLLNVLSYDAIEENSVFSTKLLTKKDDLKTTVESLKLRKIGLETATLPYDSHQNTVKLLPKNKFFSFNISELRSIKDEFEIKCAKEAVKITDSIYTKVLEHIKAGMTEIEVMTFVEQQMVLLGGRGRSFDTIVGAGAGGAIPHYVPQNKRLENGDFVVLDFGLFYNDYCSDMTRTFLVGKTPKHPEMLRVYNAVQKANFQAISKIRPGLKCSDIHQVCVDVLRDEGYLKYFNHGTGHGFGLEIHEAPSLSALRGETKLEPGMLITVEPGVYLPNIGGVRIEDDILVTNDGYERLTRSPRELVSIKGN